MTAVAAGGLTAKQRSTIDGCAVLLKLDVTALSTIARDVTGQPSVAALTEPQGEAVINVLIGRVRLRPSRARGEASR